MRAVALVAAAMLPASLLTAQGALPGPVSVESRRVRALLSSPALNALLGGDQALVELVEGCRRVMQIDSAAENELITSSGWRAPADARANTLLLVVVPVMPLTRTCARVEASTRLAESRGISIAMDTTPYDRERDIERAELRVRQRVLGPVSTDSGRMRVLTARGLQPTAAGVLQLTFDLDSLAPDSAGGLDGVELLVWTRGAARSEILPIPWSALEQVWLASLAARSERPHAVSNADLELAVLESPRDADLRAAHRAYLGRDPATANRFLLARLSGRDLQWADERAARLQLGLTFAALGDEQASRVIFGHLVRAEPCLTLSASAPTSARAVVVPLVRSPTDCASRSVALTALRAAALPGFGRPVRGRGAIARRLLIGGAIGASMLSGLEYRDASRAWYDQYQRATNAVSAERYYRLAESQRTDARLRYALAGVIWGASVAESVVREYLRERELGRVRDVAPVLEVRP